MTIDEFNVINLEIIDAIDSFIYTAELYRVFSLLTMAYAYLYKGLVKRK